jgi:hypothetical protein
MKIEEKTAIYTQELNKVITELTVKRSELGALARTTVEHLETSIPRLRNEVKGIQDEIAILNKTIQSKKEEAEKERVDYEGHYKNLERLLKDEYIKRKNELDQAELRQSERDRSNREMAVNLSDREKALSQSSENLSNLRQAFHRDQEVFESKKISETNEINRIKNEAINNLDTTNKLKKEEESKIKELSLKINELDVKIKEAENVKLRISEANKTLEFAREIERNNDQREARLNELNAKNIAENRRLSQRSEAQDKREESLNVREKNLQLIEASISKG